MSNKEINLHNRKPYRSKELKERASKEAVKCSDGTWRTKTPVLYHKPPKKSTTSIYWVLENL